VRVEEEYKGSVGEGREEGTEGRGGGGGGRRQRTVGAASALLAEPLVDENREPGLRYA